MTDQMQELVKLQETHTTIEQMCSRDRPGGDHSHRCPDPACNHSWRHCDVNRLSGGPLGEDAHFRAHCCPKCGKQQFMKEPGSYDEREAEAMARLRMPDRDVEELIFILGLLRFGVGR